jgi:hypothetical protein
MWKVPSAIRALWDKAGRKSQKHKFLNPITCETSKIVDLQQHDGLKAE